MSAGDRVWLVIRETDESLDILGAAASEAGTQVAAECYAADQEIPDAFSWVIDEHGRGESGQWKYAPYEVVP